jgi:enoyl-CoA hydratase/carnithine racemase
MDYLDTQIENGLARVRLSRTENRNALSVPMMEELRDTALALQRNVDVQAVVLYSEAMFSAGVDLSDAALADQSASRLVQRERLKLGPDLCRAWEDIEAYTIAAIEGYCVGGASALACALDYRICGRSAFFRLPEVPLGMNMSWHSIPRLVAQIGPTRTKEYVIFGKRIEAEKALEWGLCEQVVDDDQAVASAFAMAEEVLSLPPIAVRMVKESVNKTAYALAQVSSYMDRDQYLLASQSEDFAEAFAAFTEKRSPTFKGN